jgi:hypothetical protein
MLVARMSSTRRFPSGVFSVALKTQAFGLLNQQQILLSQF